MTNSIKVYEPELSKHKITVYEPKASISPVKVYEPESIGFSQSATLKIYEPIVTPQA